VRDRLITAPIITTRQYPVILRNRDGGDDCYDERDLAIFNKIAPPYPKFWLEWTPQDSSDENGFTSGCFVEVRKLKAGWGFDLWPVAVGGSGVAVGTPRLNPGRCYFAIDEGIVVPDTFWWNPPLLAVSAHAATNQTEIGVLIKTGKELAIIEASHVLFILTLLSCKNINLADRPVPDKLARIASRKYGVPRGGYRYHILTVEAPKSPRDSNQAKAQPLDSMPLHTCRGHFAEYGPKYGKKLLFGRYEGRFYVPPHVRGSEKNGVVAKDYRIANPTPQPLNPNA
jgi:hypothetical protein